MELSAFRSTGCGTGVPTLPGVGLGGTLPEVSVVVTVLGLRVLPSPVGPAVLGVEPTDGTGVPSEVLVWDRGANLARGGSGWNTSRGLCCGDCARAQSAAFPCGSAVLGVEPADGTGVPSEVLGVDRGCQPCRGWVWVEHFLSAAFARWNWSASEVLGVGPESNLARVGLGGTLPEVSDVATVLGLRVLPSSVGPAVVGVEPTDGTGVPSEVLGVGPGVPTLPGVVWVEHFRGLCCGD
ncbi:expressed unknown protein [Seminavis robusta]|uniref:Uncharacterized protein n=1 Tax=Seminavis robusta TaxID=568900 RepID=A0A9N8D597_9STRA|nr:expressed unknown protein [Seminavis robusta]|eukprot:Sro8_g006930.1 n/a (238) ;mRNA; r:250105-250818